MSLGHCRGRGWQESKPVAGPASSPMCTWSSGQDAHSLLGGMSKHQKNRFLQFIVQCYLIHIQSTSVSSQCFLSIASGIQPLPTCTTEPPHWFRPPSPLTQITAGASVSELSASTFHPLCFIFHTVTRMILLKIAKLCQFSAHTPPLTSLLAQSEVPGLFCGLWPYLRLLPLHWPP